jgi:hypothetical protein
MVTTYVASAQSPAQRFLSNALVGTLLGAFVLDRDTRDRLRIRLKEKKNGAIRHSHLGVAIRFGALCPGFRSSFRRHGD